MQEYTLHKCEDLLATGSNWKTSERWDTSRMEGREIVGFGLIAHGLSDYPERLDVSLEEYKAIPHKGDALKFMKYANIEKFELPKQWEMAPRISSVV